MPKFYLNVHLVFCTKYRRKVLTRPILNNIEEVFAEVALNWKSNVVEFNGEADHVHTLLSYPPSIKLSSLVGNLKATSCKAVWQTNERYLKRYYWKNIVLWSGGYYAESCGGVTLDKLVQYIENQQTP